MKIAKLMIQATAQDVLNAKMDIEWTTSIKYI